VSLKSRRLLLASAIQLAQTTDAARESFDSQAASLFVAPRGVTRRVHFAAGSSTFTL
jgi:hypothetical protein